MPPDATYLFSVALQRVLDVYEQVLRIKKMRDDLKATKLPAETIDLIEDNARTMFDNEIPSIVQTVMAGAVELGKAGHEPNIEVALRKSVKGIGKRMDSDFRMTVRAGPPMPDNEPADGEEPPAVAEGTTGTLSAAQIRERVIESQRRSEHQELAGEPILGELGSGDDDDDFGEPAMAGS